MSVLLLSGPPPSLGKARDGGDGSVPRRCCWGRRRCGVRSSALDHVICVVLAVARPRLRALLAARVLAAGPRSARRRRHGCGDPGRQARRALQLPLHSPQHPAHCLTQGTCRGDNSRLSPGACRSWAHCNEPLGCQPMHRTCVPLLHVPPSKLPRPPNLRIRADIARLLALRGRATRAPTLPKVGQQGFAPAPGTLHGFQGAEDGGREGAGAPMLRLQCPGAARTAPRLQCPGQSPRTPWGAPARWRPPPPWRRAAPHAPSAPPPASPCRRRRAGCSRAGRPAQPCTAWRKGGGPGGEG